MPYRTLTIAAVIAASLGPLAALPLEADWKQWGGPDRDFGVPIELADRWPTDGPETLWSRALGEGHSQVLSAGDRLFTHFGRDGEEVVIAVDADTGSTVWEFDYAVGYRPTYKDRVGPHSTPLLTGGRLFTIGIDGDFHCLRADDGSVLWKHDLVTDFGLERPQAGYAASPIAVGDAVVVQVGGSPGIVAFSQTDGKVLWAKHDVQVSHASPILIGVQGQEQLVFHLVRGDHQTGQAEVLGLHVTGRTNDRGAHAESRGVLGRVGAAVDRQE